MRRRRRPSDDSSDIAEMELKAAMLLGQLSGVVAEMLALLRSGEDEE